MENKNTDNLKPGAEAPNGTAAKKTVANRILLIVMTAVAVIALAGKVSLKGKSEHMREGPFQ